MNHAIPKLLTPFEVEQSARAALRLELTAMNRVVRVMDKMSKQDQARVMLWAITRYAPNVFTDTALMNLVRKAQGS